MLSVTEPLDSQFETALGTHEEATENSTSEKFESLNIEDKKGFCFFVKREKFI